jgi:hypothetical protein
VYGASIFVHERRTSLKANYGTVLMLDGRGIPNEELGLLGESALVTQALLIFTTSRSMV